MGQKVIIRFWWESGLSSASRNHLTTFCRPFVHHACLKVVFRDGSFYPKQLSLFCLLWLISASADRIGCITKFCSKIELLHELKTAVFNIQAFRHFITSQQGKRKTKFSGLLYITKNWKFACVLYAHSQFLCSRIANLAILKPDLEILAIFEHLWLFLEIKKCQTKSGFSGLL